MSRTPLPRIVENPSWIPRIRAGDVSAMDELFVTYFTRLTAFAVTFVVQQDVAEDIVQDVLFALWSRRDRLAVRDSLTTYLFTAVRNAGLNTIRAERTRAHWRETAQESRAGEDTLISSSTSPDARLYAQEREQFVQAAIAQLPPHYRQALTLRANGLDYDESARVLGVPVKTVRTQVARGVELLQKALLKKF